jgi:hypothetical protein
MSEFKQEVFFNEQFTPIIKDVGNHYRKVAVVEQTVSENDHLFADH